MGDGIRTPDDLRNWRHDEWCATKIGAWPSGDTGKCDCVAGIAAECADAWDADRLLLEEAKSINVQRVVGALAPDIQRAGEEPI